MEKREFEYKSKRVLVTGCCGTVGSELIAQLVDPVLGVTEVVGLDNSESALFEQDQQYLADGRVRFELSDVRDLNAVSQICDGIDVVFHCAALKHVVLCERSPMEAVHSNILGVQNIIEASRKNGVNRVIFTSSDKAVNPTSVMGTSKLMGERLMTAANSARREQATLFASTRFGNVVGSNGSVVPIFRSQIAQGGPLTLTHREMTRFIMTKAEAVKLVLESALMIKGGEVFITKMPVARIEDLAKVMIRELTDSSIEINVIGVKPGEKLYEELMSEEETGRAVELSEYFVVLPAYRGLYNQAKYEYSGVVSDLVTNPYVSAREPALSHDALKDFLVRHKVLQAGSSDAPAARYWPGDKESANLEKNA